jgi:hypothetical protein
LRRRPDPEVASRRNRPAVIAHERMTRVRVGPVVLVDLFFRRHVLLVDKDRYAYGECRRHPFRIMNIE